METIVIKLPKDKFNSMLLNGVFQQYSVTPEIKEVVVEDDLFKGDSIDADLKTASYKAYKKWQEYRYNKRHKA